MGRKAKSGGGALFDNRKKPVKAIDQAAEVYFRAVRDRLPYTKAEKEAKDTLIELMVKHRLHLYKTVDGKEVSLTDSHNVKVKEPSLTERGKAHLEGGK